MKSFYFLSAFFILFSACGDNKREISDEKAFERLKGVNFHQTRREYMQSKIDSAVLIYDLAIAEIRSGRNKEEVIKKYEFKVAELSQAAAATFNEVTSALEQNKISQEDYNRFMQEIQLERVKEKANKLNELGVQFDLNKVK